MFATTVLLAGVGLNLAGAPGVAAAGGVCTPTPNGDTGTLADASGAQSCAAPDAGVGYRATGGDVTVTATNAPISTYGVVLVDDGAGRNLTFDVNTAASAGATITGTGANDGILLQSTGGNVTINTGTAGGLAGSIVAGGPTGVEAETSGPGSVTTNLYGNVSGSKYAVFQQSGDGADSLSLASGVQLSSSGGGFPTVHLYTTGAGAANFTSAPGSTITNTGSTALEDDGIDIQTFAGNINVNANGSIGSAGAHVVGYGIWANTQASTTESVTIQTGSVYSKGTGGASAVYVYNAGTGGTSITVGAGQTVLSDKTAIIGGGQSVATLTNNGVITGGVGANYAIVLGTGAWTFNNNGLVNGNVTFNVDGDILNLTGGSSITGTTSAGASAADFLNLVGPTSGAIDLTKFQGFENLVVNSGAAAIWTVTNSGVSPTFVDGATVSGGELQVNGTLNANATVASGGLLGGSGHVAGTVTVNSGGTLLGDLGATLTVNALTLSSGANFNVGLSAPGAYGPLVQVNGALTLGGTLNVFDAGGFGVGTYRLFDYTGALTNNGMVIGANPGGNLSIQTSVAGQVNLIDAPIALEFWNGATTTANGSINGGTGTWKVGPTNWTDNTGTVTQNWQGVGAVFQAAPGTVTIDTTGGAVGANFVQFAVNGYTVGGGALTLTGATPTIRVGDGTAAGASYVATVNSVIAGSGGLTKTDLGTLVLAGANTYTGGTTIQGGVISVSADNNLGAASGGITFNTGAGELLVTHGFSTNRAVSIQSAATIMLTGNAGLGFAGPVTGSGPLTFVGGGAANQSSMNGVNSYSGLVTLNDAALVLNGSIAGTVQANNGSLFATTNGGSVSGAVAINSGADLYGIQGHTLTTGSLTLAGGSSTNVNLAAPGNATPLFQVNGALTLGGTLVVVNIGGFGPGTYNLFDYTGALTNNGMVIGSNPGGNLSIQTSVAGQVNLINAPIALEYWNGAVTTANNQINGGTGAWKVGPTNWTDSTGAVTANWQGLGAIFAGAPGTVTIDNSGGTVGANFMQFAVNGYAVNGGNLTLTGTTPTIRVGDGTAAGANDVATITSTIIGSGGLTKTDLGALVLTGANTFTGGVNINAGLIIVGADNNLGAASNAITFNGGELVGTASFSSARSLVFAASGGAIEADSGATLSFSGPLSGSGSFTKLGAGEVDITGSSAYAGQIFIGAGTLSVSGQVASPVVVQSGARLQGFGVVGPLTVQAGGAVAPGAGGTMTVDGPLTFQAGSTYEVAISPSAQPTYLIVTNPHVAAIQGGSVNVLAAPATYLLGEQFAILSAPSVTGAFTGLNQPLTQPFLQLALAYDSQDVYLEVVRNGASFCSAAATANQCAAAGGAESLGQGAGLYNAIADLPTVAAAQDAFDRISGELHASLRGAEVEDSQLIRDAALGRLGRSGDHASTVWGEVFGDQGQVSGDGDAAGVRHSSSGFLFGADTPPGQGWRIGVLGGYSQSRLSISARESSATSDDYHLAVYGGVRGAGLTARFGAAYTWHDVSTTRSVVFPGFGDQDKGSQRTGVSQVFGEVGYPVGGSTQSVEPFAGVAVVSLHGDGFSENGGAAALTGSSATQETTFTTVGLRGQTETAVSGAPVSLRGGLAWRGAAGEVTPTAALAFSPAGTPFTVAGAPISRSALVVSADVSVKVSRLTRLSLDYVGQESTASHDDSIKAGVRVSF
jgi:outer membrane autotransporter protein